METININDTGSEKEILKITITEDETIPERVVTHTKFEGTLSDLINEEIPRLEREKAALEAQVTAKQAEIDQKLALKAKVEIELDKLPVRNVKELSEEIVL